MRRRRARGRRGGRVGAGPPTTAVAAPWGLRRERGRLPRLVSPRSGRPERRGGCGARAGMRSPPGGRCRGGHGESGGERGGGYGEVGSVCEACVAGGRFIGSGRDPTGHSPASVDLGARGSSSSMTCGTRNRGDGQAGLRGPRLQ
nr:unnamed protein product [Digitaria exilis]